MDFKVTVCQSNTAPEEMKNKPFRIKALNYNTRFIISQLNTHFFEYKAKGISKWLFKRFGLSTWVELPTNTIVCSRLFCGFWLKLTIHETSGHHGAMKIIRLRPILIPHWRSAIRSHHGIKSVIKRNTNLLNPEQFFVSPEAYNKLAIALSKGKHKKEMAIYNSQ